MNEQLQEALAQLIDKALTGVDTATDFMIAETPEVVQQLLMWYAVKSFGMLLTSFLLVLVGCLTVRSIKNSKPSENEIDKIVSKLGGDSYRYKQELTNWVVFHDRTLMSTTYNDTKNLIAWGSMAIGVFTIPLGFEWVKIWIAPKIWLLEYASNLVK